MHKNLTLKFDMKAAGRKLITGAAIVAGVLFFTVGMIGTTLLKQDDTRRQLEDAGYTNVIVEGNTVFGCARTDIYKIRFKATGATGREVSGVVCSGEVKGATIRLD